MDNEIIINKVKAILDKLDYNMPDEDANYSVSFDTNEILRDGIIKDVYTVSFWDSPKQLMERSLNFALINPDTMEVIYIVTPHGYIEADGTFNDPNEW
ncbi:MAG: hypothetical protein SFW35_03955 [Chitinophagales bacterium]|nr:hypothetical protein [Chitinophagales bacterium]